MVDLIFGRSFWPMVWRFALFPVAFGTILLPLDILFFGPLYHSANLLNLTTLYTIIFQGVGWSWMGWGLAFWRFDRQEIPVKSFVMYPIVSGLAFVPIFWILLAQVQGDSSEVAVSEIILVTLFGMISGPLMALLMATFWRYAPQLTSLRKYKP